ncbi:MAG: hypothetical protein AAF547_04590 [Actinomycetota bacterium]
MAVKPGEKMPFEDLGVEVIVTKGGDGDISAEAGGGLMVGKRYECETTGVQVLVTKKGEATLLCNGNPMTLQEPKKTKSAD